MIQTSCTDPFRCLSGSRFGEGRAGQLRATTRLRSLQIIDCSKTILRQSAKLVICTYDAARSRAAASDIVPGQFATVVCDESHNLKSSHAERTRAVLPLLRAADVAILLSGTPALSRPMELFTQASVISPALFPPTDEESFGVRYCGGERDALGRFSGASSK